MSQRLPRDTLRSKSVRPEASLRSTLEERLAATRRCGRNAADHHTELASSTARLADLRANCVALTGQLQQRETEFEVAGRGFRGS